MTSASPNSPARRATAREHAKNARHAAYRGLVVEAAAEAFARDGVAATKMEHLAEAAGISLGTLYSVYRGKAEIVDALHASRLREIHAASIDAIPSTGGAVLKKQSGRWARRASARFRISGEGSIQT